LLHLQKKEKVQHCCTHDCNVRYTVAWTLYGYVVACKEALIKTEYEGVVPSSDCLQVIISWAVSGPWIWSWTLLVRLIRTEVCIKFFLR
jgi:hypothetical protein